MSTMRAQVEETIEAIRPALQADGGDIELKDVDEAQMKMVMTAKELAAKGEIMLSAGKAEDELVY